MKTFKQFQEAAFAVPLAGGISKIPSTVGAFTTLFNMVRKKGKRKIGNMEKRLHDREMNVRDNDMIRARRGEVDKQNKLIDKYEKKYTSQNEKNFRKNVTKGIKSGEVIQDEIDFVQYVKDRFKEKGLSGFIRPRKIEKKKKTIGDLLKNINTNTNEEMMAAPTNSANNNIAGLPPDDPPVRKNKPPMLKRKTYAKGGVKSRKPWLDYLKNK